VSDAVRVARGAAEAYERPDVGAVSARLSTAMTNRPSRKRHCSRGAEAPSMPEGHAERGGEASHAPGRARARHAESIDGAEHRASIAVVMAGPHAAECGRLVNAGHVQ
jgi:hypothetical protein